MMNPIKVTVLSAALAVFTLPAIAQSSDATTPVAPAPPAATQTPRPTTAPSVRQREDNQQGRIANGISDGQLTAGETKNLEKKEADINQERLDMRQENGGHLSAADKAALQQQQNKLSNQIYKDKHNSAVQGKQGYESEVGGRAEHQQDRIAQGVKSGELTGAETNHLESQEANINKEIRTDKKANGGQLTSAERSQINKQQTQLSHQIHKDKHNGHKQ